MFETSSDRRRALRALAGLAAVPWAPSRAASSDDWLVGRWAGSGSVKGESAPFELAFERGTDGALRGTFCLPSRYTGDRRLAPLMIDGTRVRLGPFEFAYDTRADTLSGTLPADLVPLYPVSVELKRAAATAQPARPAWEVPAPAPLWSARLSAPLWGGAAFADTPQGRLVVACGDDGVVHALDARSGEPRWTARTGGAIRAAPAAAGTAVFVQSDDGFLYRFDVVDGREEWRARVNATPIVRLPPSDPKTRHDFRASPALLEGRVDSGVLYLGTHEGKVLALRARDGARLWEHATDGPVLAAPTVAREQVFAASFDGRVYALDRGTGRRLWTFDTKLPVSSSPVVAGDRLIVGSRSYDLYALALEDGRVLWNRYLWYSWIESSARVVDGVAYVGSSDAAQVGAYEVGNGASRWIADVRGMAWGTPAVCGDRVFIGTRRSPSLMPHQAAALALDRATGRVVWRHPIEAPSGATPRDSWGIDASPVCDGEHVVFATVDGRLLAFRPDGGR